MKTIKDISQLKKGDRIVFFHGDDVVYFEFLCVHPRNDKYVLMIESLSQDAKKVYIPNIIDNVNYQTDYTMVEVHEREIEWHRQMIDRIQKRVEYLKDTGDKSEFKPKTNETSDTQ